VILAQALCLSVGLWMQWQFARSAAGTAAIEHSMEGLEATVRLAARELQDVDPARIRTDATGLAAVRERLTTLCPPGCRIAVLDAGWRPIVEAVSSTATDDLPLPVDQVVAWRPLIGSPSAGAGRGEIEVAGSPQIAVTRRLAGKGGHVLAYRGRAGVVAVADRLLSSLPVISLLTLLWTSALLGVAAFMLLARFYDMVERQRRRSAAEAARQRQKLIRTRDAIIFALAKLADSRDPETGDHLERIAVYSTMLAAALRRHPKYQDIISPGFVQLIGISSALHDIGKVGIEDKILRKPARLSAEERKRMQSHTDIGGACLREIELRLGSSNFLQMAREIAFAHHEQWDGQGYPKGLKGSEVPLPARIVAIADVYDALSSRRVYKDPKAHEECVRIIREESGRKFDPQIVEVWLTVTDRFAEIAQRYADESKRESSADEEESHVLAGTAMAARVLVPSGGAAVI